MRFSGSPEQDWWMRIVALFGYATNSKASIHAVGLPALGEGLARRKRKEIRRTRKMTYEHRVSIIC